MAAVVAAKWVDGVSSVTLTSEAARAILGNRLAAVQAYLPLAAHSAGEDTEHVHQLRVWTRRATAAVHFFADLMPPRRLTWLKKQLKRIRRAANEARDCDVLLERLSRQPDDRSGRLWAEAVREERGRAQDAIIAVLDRLKKKGRFSRRIKKLLERLEARGKTRHDPALQEFGKWARRQLMHVVDQFFASAPTEGSDEAALHQFRICGKELRYAMELVAAVFPEEFRSGLYPAIEALQDRLGAINDLVTSKARLCRKIKAARDPSEAGAWRQLLAGEQARLDQAIREFHSWCTPRMLDELRVRFEAMRADPAPSPEAARPTSPGQPIGSRWNDGGES